MADSHYLSVRQQLLELPRWAAVAFAVRCASRVEPLVRPTDAALARQAIWLAAQAARRPLSSDTSVLAGASFKRSISPRASDAAARAADAAVRVAAANADTVAILAPLKTVLASSAAAAASFDPTTDAEYLFLNAIERDMATLLARSQATGWTRDTAVDPDELGPLWPDGEPEGWPEPAPPPGFCLAIDPGDADQDTLREVLDALSELHEVHTGYALAYSVDGTLVRAESGVLA